MKTLNTILNVKLFIHIDNLVTFLPGRDCSSEHTSLRGLWYCLWNTGEPKTPNLLCENPVRQKVLNLTSLNIYQQMTDYNKQKS